MYCVSCRRSLIGLQTYDILLRSAFYQGSLIDSFRATEDKSTLQMVYGQYLVLLGLRPLQGRNAQACPNWVGPGQMIAILQGRSSTNGNVRQGTFQVVVESLFCLCLLALF